MKTRSREKPNRQAEPSNGRDGRNAPEHIRLPSDHDRIKARAFEVYQHRKGVPGSALIDWLRAEWECQMNERGDLPGSPLN